MARKRKPSGPETRRFVQVADCPSVGIDISTGQAWIGVDQQVGHGSADALFALTNDQYVTTLTTGGPGADYLMECWRGDQEQNLLFHPGGGSWNPEHWFGLRERMIYQPFAGELWRYIDALGQPEQSSVAEIARELAGPAVEFETGPDGVVGMRFQLAGEGAHPREAALIAGLRAGSTREQVRAFLGRDMIGDPDEFGVEGARVRLGYDEGGLTEISLALPTGATPPGGDIGIFLDILGTPECGPEYQAVTELVGGRGRRWSSSRWSAGVMTVFDGGVDVHVRDDQVRGTRIRLRAAKEESVYQRQDALITGLEWPAGRADLQQVLGMPAAASSSQDLYDYGRRLLIVDYQRVIGEQQVPATMTTVLRGATVSPKFHRWRSGDFTRFLDILGREPTNPLVRHVTQLPGVQVRLRHDVVAQIEIGTSDHQTERFAAFIDGMPSQPTRRDLPLGAPHYVGPNDALWDYEPGVVHVRGADNSLVTSIGVSADIPTGLDVRPWSWVRDRWRR